MRKIAMILLVVLFVFGCGGGGGGGESASGAPAPVPAKISLAPIPAGDLTEIINFLVNKEYADAHPELEGNVRQIVADINTVLGKDPDNKKRYALGKVMTYADAAALYTIGTTPAYFTDNNFTGKRYDGTAVNYGGTTVVYDVGPVGLSNFFLDVGNGAGAFAATTFINGKKYGEVFISELETATTLLGRDNLSKFSNGLSEYDQSIAILLHELGHTHGLGVPDWYSLISADNSGTLPKLSLNFQAQFPQDPMSGANVMTYNIQEYKFTPFNSWLIQHNANHQLNTSLIEFAAQNYVETRVKVVDTSGAPVPDATVTVYGGVSSDNALQPNIGVARNMETVLQTHTTDANGMAFLERGAWFARGIKASRNEKYAGAVITLIDMEDVYFRQGLSTYVLTLQLR